MNRRTFVKTLPAFTMLASTEPVCAQDLPPIVLPKPEKDGGKSVLAALWERKTIHDISTEKLPPQVLSNLLWAAFGVNRQNGPLGRVGRTAASAHNSQEIDVYVAMSEGVYLYLYEAVVAGVESQSFGPLPVPRGEREHAGRRPLLLLRAPVGAEMAQSPQPMQIVFLGRVPRLPGPLPAAETADRP